MRRLIINFTWGLLFIFSPIIVKCNHIVGGEITIERYDPFGGGINNMYQINLTIYRDCTLNSNQPWFDDPAIIGFYDDFGNLYNFTSLVLENESIDTLPPIVFDSCSVVPPNACIHKAEYSTIRFLPPIDGGYHIVYQRCCRSSQISNIVTPENTGVTFSVYFSAHSLNVKNSTPKFPSPPPNFFCVNEPVFLDHSILDLEGDSVVYELCSPLQGASLVDPMPSPPNGPPFQPVNWLSPTYSLENMLGGTALSINSTTGFITGTPTSIGQFVVGICVKEYRGDTLLSTIRRDFVYFVGICLPLYESNFDYEIGCDGSTIQFINQSENATIFCWDFDFENTCQEVSPTVQFPNEGDYLITLIAEPNHGCADTSEQILTIEKLCGFESLESGIQIEASNTEICIGEKSQLTVPFCDDYSYQWNPLLELSLDNIHNPIVSPQNTTTYEVEIFDGDNCVWVEQIEIKVLEFCDKPVIKFPNIFTPDGDGVNDTFGGLSFFQFQSYDFKVFSRWGELVFNSNKIEDKWDGMFKGKQAISDVYVWTLEYSYKSKNEVISKIEKGDITLIR